MRLYLLVTQDELSYPRQMTTSLVQMQKLTGVDHHSIRSSIYKNNQREYVPKGGTHNGAYRKWEQVTIPDDLDVELVTDEMWEHYKAFCQHRQKDKEQE